MTNFYEKVASELTIRLNRYQELENQILQNPRLGLPYSPIDSTKTKFQIYIDRVKTASPALDDADMEYMEVRLDHYLHEFDRDLKDLEGAVKGGAGLEWVMRTAIRISYCMDPTAWIKPRKPSPCVNRIDSTLT